MTRLAAAALPLALALLLTPAVMGQGTTHNVAIAIEDLPATVRSNGTQVAVAFNVTAVVSGAPPCVASPGASSYTILLSSDVTNSTGTQTASNVNPRQTTIAGPVLIPVTGGNGLRRIPATLVIQAGPYTGDSLNATVKVTATMTESSGGCAGLGSATFNTAEDSVDASFEPVRGFGAPASQGQQMPGAGFALIALALAAVAVLRRRQA